MVAGDNAAITVDGRQIVVSGVEGKPVRIVATDGKAIHAAVGDTRVEVMPGVYLVSVARFTRKVVVR